MMTKAILTLVTISIVGFMAFMFTPLKAVDVNQSDAQSVWKLAFYDARDEVRGAQAHLCQAALAQNVPAQAFYAHKLVRAMKDYRDIAGAEYKLPNCVAVDELPHSLVAPAPRVAD